MFLSRPNKDSVTGFEDAFRETVGHEGGFQNDPNDRGNWTTGKIGVGVNKGTKYGISAMSYPSEDIKNLTLERAKTIYKRDYWDKCRCDELPALLGPLVFDAAVNHGQKKAIQLLQEAVGTVVDGTLGPKTLIATIKVNPEDLVTEYCVRRGLYFASLSTFPRYGLGWFRRLFRIHRSAFT